MVHSIHAAGRLLFAATAAAAVLASTSANAQSATFGSGAARNWGKSDAILGAPSALEAILAQQSGQPARKAVLRPASYSAPMTPAIIRGESTVSAGVASGRPDVFGSVALRITRAPLMARWQRVQQSRLVGPSARYAQSLSEMGEVERLEAVNRYVNDRVQFIDDIKQYGRADVWSAAADTLTRGRGDCEDYAIAKLQMLRRAGFSDRNMYLVIVKDLVSRGDHAVLVVRAAGQMYVLDNGTSKLLNSEEIHDYRPILSFAAAGGAWTHGYRVHTSPMNIASAEGTPASPLAPADDQRSRSASLLAFNTGFNK